MADWTTTGLLASIRRRASIPTTATTGGANADLIAYANEELRLGLIAEILRLRESYFKRDSDTAISGSTYRIPTRAIGGKLAAVYLLDSSSQVLGDPLAEISDAHVGQFSGSGVCGYQIKGANLILVPGATTSASYLRMTYFEQPNELVATGYATIETVVSTTVLDTTASHGFSTSSVLDFVKATEGFESLSIGVSPTVASSDDLTFASLPDGLVAGDYVCVQRQSPVPQIPSEFHPILAQRVAVAWLEAQGAPELDAARGKLGEMQAAIGVLSSPRVDTGSKKIINRFSPLGHMRGYRREGV